ncbi:hypothetical protein KJ885_00745 [Patescibacteria group bacterium]|nr:hypothetical protein [Patescibacteria group bacterium]
MEPKIEMGPPRPEKPKGLYHASSNKEVTEFEPRAESYRDPEEGPVVFATPDKAFASMFIVPTDGSWVEIVTFDNVNCIAVADEERFKKLDKGGSIYSLPNDQFECDINKSKNECEWTSRDTVKPEDQLDYDLGLDAMIENGVQVYFVDQATFEKIQQSDDLGLEILKSLKSENQKSGKNVKKLPEQLNAPH